jgi:hypothetical protein
MLPFLRDGFDVDNFAATSGSEARIVSAMLGDKNNVSSGASRSHNYSTLNTAATFGGSQKDISGWQKPNRCLILK